MELQRTPVDYLCPKQKWWNFIIYQKIFDFSTIIMIIAVKTSLENDDVDDDRQNRRNLKSTLCLADTA